MQIQHVQNYQKIVKHLLDVSALLTIHTSLIWPHLDYYVELRENAYPTNLKNQIISRKRSCYNCTQSLLQ